MLNIDDPNFKDPTPALFRLGFRPMFLAGAAAAALLIPLWLLVWYLPGQSPILSPSFFSPVIPIWWHPHEMLFGFAMAIVAGFLLTATQNWTNQPGLKGWPLALVFFLWLLARVSLMLPTAIPLWLPALADTGFLLITAGKIGHSIIKVHQWRNLGFPLLLLLATGANLYSYYALYQRDMVLSSTLWQAMIWWMALMITFVGGRVVPFFTAIRIKRGKPSPLPYLDWPLFIALAILAINSVTHTLSGVALQGLLVVAGTLQLVRQARWFPHKTLKEPMLWSLHLSYLCIALALLGMALFLDNPHIERQMLHLVGVGAIGGMCLSMISRVSLGHTGRNIYAGPAMAPGFVMILAAALVRAFGPILWPENTIIWHWLAASLWTAAFGLFLWHYTGMLSKPRLDGRPG
ncbi:NnrS family protein [Ferrimonas sp.]|uniref:NnrS family protein n=1 Tax=Ferrimonas sp. TaxID=2080861 RepID=UPI003A9477D0